MTLQSRFDISSHYLSTLSFTQEYAIIRLPIGYHANVVLKYECTITLITEYSSAQMNKAWLINYLVQITGFYTLHSNT